MLEHHIQKDILSKLVHVPAARFADLKPPTVDGNIFTYHLQQLVKTGLVEKTDEGQYRLTAAGKTEGISSGLNPQDVRQQAHPILLLCVRDSDGRWLLRKRTVHPMYGRIGFVHGEPKAGESVIETAGQRLRHKTGLQADFTVAGSGFIAIYQADDLESYTQFTLLTATAADEKLIDKDETGENRWFDEPDFTGDEFIPSMADLAALVEAGSQFFTELMYKL